MWAMRFEEAIAILRALEREDVRYVLIGSMAMAAQGIVRATNDIDFFISSEESNVDRLKRALRSIYDDPSIEQINAGELAGAFPVIRYGPPQGEFVIDFIARIGDMFAFEDVDAETIVVQEVRIRVATPRMLYRMKRDTVRPQDKIDAVNLQSAFDLSEDEE